MSDAVSCSECGRKYKITPKIAGRKIRCQQCEAVIRVPELETELDDDLFWESEPAIAPIPGRGRSSRSEDRPERLNVSPSRKKRLRLTSWPVVFGALGGMMLLICGGIILTGYSAYAKFKTAMTGDGQSIVSGKSLAEARAQHPTVLLRQEPSPQPYDEFTIADAERVAFTSEGLELFGWFAKPEGEGPFPAVLHAHGGMALGESDFDDVRPFLEAGYAVFVPAWRGENGNPGSYEFVFGEVHDAAAALDYLAGRPDIKADELFATGHSVGGTLVMLLAEISPRLKGGMACGGCPDVQTWTVINGGMPFEANYDDGNPIEGDLRSAARHLQDLNCPLLLFYGLPDDTYYHAQAEVMVANAQQSGQSVRMEVIPGTDHYTALKPAIVKAMLFFNGIRQ